jgi:pyridoxal phosphate enzyme (YggS family)
MSDDLQIRLTTIHQRIHAACMAAGRTPSEITLMGVSKGQPAEKIQALYDLGLRDFGENYLQELESKAFALQHLKDIRWHFIGALQSNKIAKVVAICSTIHTVASERYAKLIADDAKKLNKTPYPIYLQVNIGEETQKQGLAYKDVPPVAHVISTTLPTLALQGIMAIPPPEYNDQSFVEKPLPDMYENLKKLSLQVGLKKLSLGMSSDLGLAIKAQSTIIRIGRDLFGERV